MKQLQSDIDNSIIKRRWKKATPAKLVDEPADGFDDEIKMAADISVYYNTATSRFTESICLSMRASLFGKLVTDVPNKLKQSLALDPSQTDKLQEFMKEDAGVTHERQELLKERDNHEEGKKIIKSSVNVV